MKKILATAAVLAFAGVASADAFVMDGAIDFSGGTVAGGMGERLTWSGTADWGPFGGTWFGPAFTNTGFQLATPGGASVGTGLVGNFELNPGDFGGAVFSTSGAAIPSGVLSIDGFGDFDAVQIGHFGPGLSDFAIANGGSAFVQIGGVNQELLIDADSGSGYSLTFVPLEATGGSLLYVINGTIPTPGAAGLLGLAGLAAVRRRR